MNRVSGREEPRVELLCVGTELLSGRLNTHQSYLSIELLKIGLDMSRESSLPDNLAAITGEIRLALKRSDVILISGGLGPTFDDITRDAAAKALGRRLVYQPRLFAAIRRRFARYRLPVPQSNKRQAYLIAGAQVLKNSRGSAPGQIISIKRPKAGIQTIVLLPGPRAELAPMFESQVLPLLKRRHARHLRCESLSLHMSGIPESVADEKLQNVLAQSGPGLDFTILASIGQVDFFARAKSRDSREAVKAIKKIREQAYAALGNYIFAEDGQSIEKTLGEKLRERGLTLAVAESCTGGMLGERLTDAPGSSEYFRGGAVVYSNALKDLWLKVRVETLRRHGAVSGPCASEMARNIRGLSKADIGLSVTGIAGPGGAAKGKPVGLVFIALAGPARASRCWRFIFPGDRHAVRQRAVSSALYLLLRHLDKIDSKGEKLIKYSYADQGKEE